MIRSIRKFFKHYKLLGFALVAALLGLGLEFAAQDLAKNIVLAFAAGVVSIPIIIDMVRTLRSGHFGVDVLAITAIATAVILQEYWAAMIIVLMLTGGEALEDYAERRAKKELSTLLSNRPKIAHLQRAGKTTDIKASEVSPGDKIVVLPGEVVPVDGTILEGSTNIDEASITGESIPINKQLGDEVLSGSVNIDGAITIRASHTAAESQYEQIIKLVKNATSGQSPFVRMADRYSVPFTAIAFMVSGAAWFVSGDSMRFLEVLVVATPCPLLLGAPIAIISGMSRASKNGVIIKTGSALEQLAAVRTVAFDKTGTLTKGQPVIDHITTFGSHTAAQVAEAAAALEQSSTHILARAITNYAASKQLRLSGAKHVKEIPGKGLSGRLRGSDILVGHLSLLADHGVELPKAVQSNKAKQTVTYVAIKGHLAGAITFSDQIRPEASSMLARLKKAGVRQFALITGDNEAAAGAIAKQLHIDDVYANCLPSQKIQAIEQMNGPVAFVGDGVNDAPVLTSADVGIALGARGSTAASETADVVIMHDDVSRVATSVEIARRTVFIAKQSVLIGIIISIGLMAAFATGRFTAVQGALIQEVVDIIVIINALRAHGAWRTATEN